MANAQRDDNYVTTLLGTSLVDDKKPVRVFADPATGRLLVTGIITASSVTGDLDRFGVNNIKTIGLVTYIGMEDKDGAYCIKKIDSTTDNVFTYATITNNPTVATYALAWAGIATNTYSIYSGAF